MNAGARFAIRMILVHEPASRHETKAAGRASRAVDRAGMAAEVRNSGRRGLQPDRPTERRVGAGCCRPRFRRGASPTRRTRPRNLRQHHSKVLRSNESGKLRSSTSGICLYLAIKSYAPASQCIPIEEFRRRIGDSIGCDSNVRRSPFSAGIACENHYGDLPRSGRTHSAICYPMCQLPTRPGNLAPRKIKSLVT